MDNSLQINGLPKKLLEKMGGGYIILSVAFAQIAASIGALLGFISEQLNADYAPEVVTLLRRIEIVVLPITAFLLIVVVYILSRNTRASLDLWKKNPEQFANEDNAQAWKASQNIIWKYAIAAAIISIGFIIIPKTLLLLSSGHVNQDQVIYGLISGIISSIAFVPLSTIILDRLLGPVRQVLLPKNFNHQISGLNNIKLLYKTLAVAIFSLLISALLIAPIGYHQTTKVLFEDVDPQKVLIELQLQSIFVSGLAIILASGLAFLLARSVSDPLASIMDSFSQVEEGNLSARAPVVSSDEISHLSIYFNRMVSRLQDLQGELENKVEQRTAQLKAINEVSRAVTSILDPDDLLRRVVNLIKEEFGYYYSAAYMIDQTGQWAELIEATGEAGKVLKESNHRIEITSLNVIGRAIRSRKPQFALDVGEKVEKIGNPLLPYSRSELVLPLYAGDQILGALDVHSSEKSAFTEQDIETLQNMANQVAISLDNARLFQETRQSLNEMRNIQKLYLQDAWIENDFAQGGITLAVGEESISDNNNSVEVPITLREQIIGQLMLESEETLSQDDKNWIQSIATQTALALENARLLNESQSMAMREKFVTEITNKIWASTSLESVLQTTIRELGQILDATEATIELNIDNE